MSNKEWESTSLGKLIDVKHGFAFQGEYFVDDTEADILLTPGNFGIGGGFKGDKYKYYRGPLPNEYILQQGDLIVTMTDLSKQGDTLGYPALVPQQIGGRAFLHNQRIGKIIILETKKVDKLFLYYLMCTRGYRNEVLASATGTSIKHTSPSRIKNFQFNLPPLPQQQRIAEILGALDDKIELNRRMNRTLEAMARALFQSWFVDFDPVYAKARGETPYGMDEATAALFPDSFEETAMGRVPRGWGVSTIGEEVIRLPVGKKYETKTVVSEGKVPVLDQGKSGIIGYHNDAPGVYADLKNPVVVFANHTCYMRLVHFPFSAIQNVLPFVGKELSTIWIYYATVDQIKFEEYKGHWPDFARKMIVVPPSLVAQKFDEFIAPFVHHIYYNEQEISTLSTLRDTLLPKLVNVEINQEPVAELI